MPPCNKTITNNRTHITFICIITTLFISIQFISSSKFINIAITILQQKQEKQTIDSKLPPFTLTSKKQRICILAGPHKTASTSVQGNFYRWSKPTVNFTDSIFVQLPQPLLTWIWPVPEEIARVEHNDTHNWHWAPSKIFYPMMEALTHKSRLPKKRVLFRTYTAENIVDMYRQCIGKYWDEGYNIVFGTEAMDMVIKLPEGPSMIHKVSNYILPKDIDGDQVNVVVMYRTPKIDHLISMWHQNCPKQTDEHFYKWISTTTNTLGPLDALGMVDFFLNQTNWNVDLVNLEGMKEENWDVSNFVACKILGEKCIGKVIKGLYDGSEPVMANVRSGQRGPNVPNETLDDMDIVLNSYDCNYIHLLRGGNPRLKIHFRSAFKKVIKSCNKLGKVNYPQTRIEMRERIKEFALHRGTLEPVNETEFSIIDGWI